jgi:hypothetical protein
MNTVLSHVSAAPACVGTILILFSTIVLALQASSFQENAHEFFVPSSLLLAQFLDVSNVK